MVVWKFKSCPRCEGDVFLDGDLYNWYEQCFQCGYIRDLKNMDEFNELIVESRKKRATSRSERQRR